MGEGVEKKTARQIIVPLNVWTTNFFFNHLEEVCRNSNHIK